MTNPGTVFKLRPTKCIDRWATKNWNLKVYAITIDIHTVLNDEVTEAAKNVINSMSLPNGGGYGFVTIHAGDEAIWLLVDVWVDDILHHYLYSASLERPTEFAVRNENGTFACVWELLIVSHERTAWVDHVMRDGAPDHRAYLDNTYAV